MYRLAHGNGEKTNATDRAKRLAGRTHNANPSAPLRTRLDNNVYALG